MDQSSVLSFLSQTLTDADREHTADAVIEMAASAGGYPYKMQVIGDAAWKISGSRSTVVDSRIADLAIREADRQIRRRIHKTLWHDLPQSDQAILKAVARHDGSVDRRTLGASLPLESSHVTHRAKELLDIGCLSRDGQGPIEFGPLASMQHIEDVMRDEAESEMSDVGGLAAAQASARTRSHASPRCGKKLKTVEPSDPRPKPCSPQSSRPAEKIVSIFLT